MIRGTCTCGCVVYCVRIVFKLYVENMLGQFNDFRQYISQYRHMYRTSFIHKVISRFHLVLFSIFGWCIAFSAKIISKSVITSLENTEHTTPMIVVVCYKNFITKSIYLFMLIDHTVIITAKSLCHNSSFYMAKTHINLYICCELRFPLINKIFFYFS